MTYEAIATTYRDTQTRLPALATAQSLVGQHLASSMTGCPSLIIEAVREDTTHKRVYVIAMEQGEERHE